MPVKSKYGDLTGKKIWEWTVLGPLPLNGKPRKWRCKCSCGAVHDVDHGNLVRDGSKMCRKCTYKKQMIHGHTRKRRKTPTYHVWRNLERKPNVCDRWRRENNGFINFLHDMGTRPRPFRLHHIGLRDKTKPYSPENCFWERREALVQPKIYEMEGIPYTSGELAFISDTTKRVATIRRRIEEFGMTPKEAISAPTPGRLITAFGETKTVTEWLNDTRCKAKRWVINKRIALKKMSPEEAITTPPTSKERFVEAFGEVKSLDEWTKDPRCAKGVNKNTLQKRLETMPAEEAISRTLHRQPRYKAFGTSKSLRGWVRDPRCAFNPGRNREAQAKAMCLLRGRMQDGMTLEEALVRPLDARKSHPRKGLTRPAKPDNMTPAETLESRPNARQEFLRG